MRARSIAVLLCALLCACSGKGRPESTVSAPLKPGKAVVVIGIGLPSRDMTGATQRMETSHLVLEFARLTNGRAETGISVAEPTRWELDNGTSVVYRIMQVDPGTYALARASTSADLANGDFSSSPMGRNATRSPFLVHELATETAYQFKVAAGEIAYVGDYTVDLNYRPTRITVGHTMDRAILALKKHPQYGPELADKSPALPMPTGLPPRAMQMNDPMSRIQQIPTVCPPMCN
ncbi:MAG: hypothetical protein H7Z12_01660 [Rhodospirillaceae bacterium]|nr:hypothetical protein [Rhodospirillales bacterium]